MTTARREGKSINPDSRDSQESSLGPQGEALFQPRYLILTDSVRCSCQSRGSILPRRGAHWQSAAACCCALPALLTCMLTAAALGDQFRKVSAPIPKSYSVPPPPTPISFPPFPSLPVCAKQDPTWCVTIVTRSRDVIKRDTT